MSLLLLLRPTPAPVFQDDFEDGVMGAIWDRGTLAWGGLNQPPNYPSGPLPNAGYTTAETGGVLSIYSDGTSKGGWPAADGYISHNTQDLQGDRTWFCKATISDTANYEVLLGYGVSGGDLFAARHFNGAWWLHYEGSASGNFGGTNQRTITTHPWVRLHYHIADNTFSLDVAPAAANNPPLESEWEESVRVSAANLSNLNTTAGYVSLWTTAPSYVSTPGTVTFDAFNGPTVAAATVTRRPYGYAFILG